MTFKKGISILKSKADRQLEFIEWLKSKKLYNPMESAVNMQKMYDIWEKANNNLLNKAKILLIGIIIGGFLRQLLTWLY
jgi:hypothetical protein